jgi:phosphoribosylformylglycinamidine synthase
LDYNGKGVATSMGHSPGRLLDPVAGSRTAIARLYQILFGLLSRRQISLSANWMWACKNEGGCSFVRCRRKLFNSGMGINIPTGKTPDETKPNDRVIAPGTVIISAGGMVEILEKW